MERGGAEVVPQDSKFGQLRRYSKKGADFVMTL
jgi:hypothetical protein